ncbi:carbohydrate esterase family 4 protein [Serendipita vermifera MAFF 305830]|uniref:chitin deacetylase n=1 Tax=Serendipita vermifera MAFF 305830 TaxID=933852 RepID=A0A0C3B342_SERVB|nr:carbohydrate esterase family 4 protein [Serendipita vermifera MAFF 305830]
MFSAFLVLSTLVSSIAGLPAAHVHEEATVGSALPTTWYHKRDHPVHNLFRRGPLPVVGSPAWQAAYPGYGTPPESNIPQPWLDALKEAEDAHLIPTFAPAISTDGGQTNAGYGGANGGQEPICSSQFQCRHPGDIWDAPDGMIGLSVDDGPIGLPQASERLYDFLKLNNQKVTHFMIGANILGNPSTFMRAFEELQDDIAVHTWTHRHMSTLTNRQLVADLGWTMQIIHDSTGGRVPRYWRPPYGDCDNRVRAIAKEVFGLTTVIWNQDSQDWTMAAPGGTTLPAIQASFTRWLNGPRSPGLIVLEHEITADDVTAFMNMYPLIAAATGGAPWQAVSVAQLFDGHHGPGGPNGTMGWYQNADDNTSPVTSAEIISGLVTGSASATASGAHNGTVSSGTAVATSTPTTVRNAAMRTVGAGVGASGLVLAAVLFTLAL